MKSLTEILRKGKRVIATGATVAALSYATLPFCAMAKDSANERNARAGVERQVVRGTGECPYELKWIKTSEAEPTTDLYVNDMAIDPDDGDIVLAGYTDKNGFDVHVEKTDLNGEPKWVFEWGGEKQDIAWGVCTTQENGQIFHYVVGDTASIGNGRADGFALKLDEDGTSVSLKALGGTNWEKFNSVCPAENNGIYAAGFTRSFGGWNSWIMKLDLNLNKMWERFPYQEEYDEVTNSICQTSDKNGCCFVGEFTIEESDPYGRISNLDSEGNRIFSENLREEGSKANKIISLSDGGYCVAGSIGHDAYMNRFQLMLVNSDGTSNGQPLIWGRDNGNNLEDVCELNGELVVLGSNHYERTNYLGGVSSNLTFNWKMNPTYLKEYHKIKCIEPKLDSEGFIVAGYESSGNRLIIAEYELPKTSISGWTLY